jgi:hypothetical protein
MTEAEIDDGFEGVALSRAMLADLRSGHAGRDRGWPLDLPRHQPGVSGCVNLSLVRGNEQIGTPLGGTRYMECVERTNRASLENRDGRFDHRRRQIDDVCVSDIVDQMALCCLVLPLRERVLAPPTIESRDDFGHAKNAQSQLCSCSTDRFYIIASVLLDVALRKGRRIKKGLHVFAPPRWRKRVPDPSP